MEIINFFEAYPHRVDVIEIRNCRLADSWFSKLCHLLDKGSSILEGVELINVGISDERAIKLCTILSSRYPETGELKFPSLNLVNLSDNTLTDRCLESVFKLCEFIQLIILEANNLGDGVAGFKDCVPKSGLVIELAGNNISEKVCSEIRPFEYIHTPGQEWESSNYFMENFLDFN